MKPANRHHYSLRRGITTPAVAGAIVVVMACLALILDRLWLEAARLELQTAAEAAALAAARQLVGDHSHQSSTATSSSSSSFDQTSDDSDERPGPVIVRAIHAAEFVAAHNRVAGDPVVLMTGRQSDVLFGHLVRSAKTAKVRFVESLQNPSTVLVTAQRTHVRNNPVGLFVAGLTGLPWGDVRSTGEATLSQNVVGLKPFAGGVAPLLPLAILESEPTQQRTETWVRAIEKRQGKDEYCWDADEKQVGRGSDGIPEITLTTAPRTGEESNPNARVVDLGNQLEDHLLQLQISGGINSEDLDAWGGQLLLPAKSGSNGSPLNLRSRSQLPQAVLDSLEQIVGESRIALLYKSDAATTSGQTETANCTRMIALRVMAVRADSRGMGKVVVQPTTISTRTALLGNTQTSSVQPADSTSDEGNPVADYSTDESQTNIPGSQSQTVSHPPYIVKIQISH